MARLRIWMLVVCLASGLALSLWGCDSSGGGGKTSGTPVGNPTITLDVANNILPFGASTLVTAIVRTADGALADGVTVTFVAKLGTVSDTTVETVRGAANTTYTAPSSSTDLMERVEASALGATVGLTITLTGDTGSTDSGSTTTTNYSPPSPEDPVVLARAELGRWYAALPLALDPALKEETALP